MTGPEPGLTRDAVVGAAARRRRHGDRAGGYRGAAQRARVDRGELEKMSAGAAIGALKLAEVVVLVIDAAEGLHDQDLQIAQLIEREGRAAVLALNKWDAVPDRSARPPRDRRPAGGRAWRR